MNATSASNETTLGIPNQVAMKALAGILPETSARSTLQFTLSAFEIFVLQTFKLMLDNFRFLLTRQLCLRSCLWDLYNRHECVSFRQLVERSG